MKANNLRIAALRRFAIAISTLTLFGHLYLGFEQSYAYPVVAIFTAYIIEIVLETIDAWSHGRIARYKGGVNNVINFLLPAHISALAVAMLLYSNEHLWPIILAVSIAIGSKHVFHVTTNKGKKHFFNPSNLGISVVLILYPWVGIAPPYQFTENIFGVWDWVLPVFLIFAGTFLNFKFTNRIPLITAWLVGFFIQAVIRSWYFDTPVFAALAPLSGVAFLLFTFYMISDPGTTPYKRNNQILFGLGVAVTYGLLVVNHIVFGLFFALSIMCIFRGMAIYLESLFNNKFLAKVEIIKVN